MLVVKKFYVRNFKHAGSLKSSVFAPRIYKTFASAMHQDMDKDYHLFKISPAALHIIIAKQADHKSIKGTGRRGMIMKEDVLRFLKLIPESTATTPAQTKDMGKKEQTQNVPKTPQSVPTAQPPKVVKKEVNGKEIYQDLELDSEKLQRINAIAKSKLGTAHSYISSITEVDGVLELLNEKKADGITLESFLIKASAIAFRNFTKKHRKESIKVNALAIMNNAQKFGDIFVINEAENIQLKNIAKAKQNTNSMYDVSREVAEHALILVDSLSAVNNSFSVLWAGQNISFSFSNISKKIAPADSQGPIDPFSTDPLVLTGNDEVKAKTLMTASITYNAGEISMDEAASCLQELTKIIGVPYLALM